MPEVKATMKMKKETKNKWRYEEVDETGQTSINPSVETMYLPKSLLSRNPPRVIQVLVKWEGA